MAEIALLTHSVLPRGGVVHTLELAEELTARGHSVTVIAPFEPGQTLFRSLSCKLALIPLATVQGSLVEQVCQRIAGLVKGLPAILAAGRFDLLHAQDSLSGNALAELQPATPWVRTIHHLDDFSDPQLAAWQTRAWRSASAVACISEMWCVKLADDHNVEAERMFNGVNLARFQPRAEPGDAALLRGLGVREHQPLCLALGGVEQRKNSVRLLQAFARLRASDPAWAQAQLLIVGGASLLDHSAALRGWRAALAKCGLTEGPDQAVWRTGPLPDALLPPLMRRAWILAMPSLMEGFGLVALEALACGTPVLVSNRKPFTEHLADCPHVAWCDPEDITSIADGLRAASTLPRPGSPPAVCIAHSWSRSAELHEAWYRQVLGRHASSTKGLPHARHALHDSLA